MLNLLDIPHLVIAIVFCMAAVAISLAILNRRARN
jgi:hypothetical protein